MYSSDRKQYLFKQSTEKVWNLYYEPKLGICYSVLTRKNTWTDPISIRKNCHPCFFADMDSSDCFHLLYQDNGGNIFYLYINGDTVKSIPVLQSKSPNAYDKNLFLTPGKNYVHLFFTLQHNQSTLLSHQVLSNDTPSKPRVLDYVTNGPSPYSVCRDKAGNLYAFYPSSDGKHLQIGFKKYTTSQNLWSDFTPIAKYAGDCELARCINDENNALHLCYQRRASRQYELVYQQKIPDKNLWSEATVLHSSSYPFTEASLLLANNHLHVYWVREDAIYYTVSRDLGKQWSKPARNTFSGGRQVFCAAYKTNTTYESEKILVREIPVIFTNGFKFPFYQEPSASANALSPDELRNMIVESLTLLKNSVDELKEANASLVKNMTQITNAQQSLDREFTKLELRMNLVENEVIQCKKIAQQVQNHDHTLTQILMNSQSTKPDISLSNAEKKKLRLAPGGRWKRYAIKQEFLAEQN